eukprot:9820959-Ditylum_brightwellii.AAC.1
MALFHSVTHSAPSDHACGFSGPNMPLLSHNVNPNAALVASKPGSGIAPIQQFLHPLDPLSR